MLATTKYAIIGVMDSRAFLARMKSGTANSVSKQIASWIRLGSNTASSWLKISTMVSQKIFVFS